MSGADTPATSSARVLLDNPRTLSRGVAHVSKADRRIRKLVERHGQLEFSPRGRPFDSLVESILSQQLNGSAAESIISRFYRLFLPGRLTAAKLKAVPSSRLRKAGVSPQKARYLKDLARRLSSGGLVLSRIVDQDDEAIIQALDEVKGVGRWTAQMVLIFSLGRPDVLPVDDFGIRTAVKRVYGLRSLPTPRTIEKIAEAWHPFCTVACLYLWKHKDWL